ncbi:transketolase family protein, partial [Klebsiella pneumoniae]|uniref:transketolase family protein n=1 Tax=Klebsiella pneumoniae TaxID=573 RepID=UPI003F1B31AA
LSMDAVQKAKSGHPGAPMGMADIAEVLWRDFLNHNPNNPAWADRDRFVLSNGHGSMLIYSLLHLTGYDLPISELKNFRQLHSKTPGHPEVGYTAGVETTTGPLGQGIANAVGMAIAEKTLAAQFNRPGHDIVDHYTYAFMGDGCMMEGISHEVCSLAGTLKLGKLVAFYDDNGISWKHAPFDIPSDIYAQWDAKEAGQAKEAAWNEKFAAYAKAFPQEAAEFTRRMKGEMPSDFDAKANEFIAKLQANPAKIASRKASQNAIEAFGPLLPEFLGGSADLAPSNLTLWSGSKPINEDAAGNYIHYGVREFGMTAIANGIALHGGFLPYTSTFLMFVEYARNAVRMAALMKQRQVMVYTHDSIGLGEDGPTHQPVEQVASLRVTPNMSTWRPCDQVESAIAWKYGVERQDGPTALILSRQNLAQQERTAEQLANVARGGYVLKDCAGQPELIFIATGSEVELAVAAWDKLTAEGVKARVVSMPSTDAFDKQDAAYRESVLPKAVTARVAVEAGIADYWFKYVGLNGAIVGMTTFGESAPAEQLFEEFGFTVDNVVAKAKALL